MLFVAGHGSQSRDPTGDEADGMNETLCPTDFKQAGQIIDDEINQSLINLVPQGVSLCEPSLHRNTCLDVMLKVAGVTVFCLDRLYSL